METGLSLGSNVGDRLANLSEARRRIAALEAVSVVAASPVYETEPVGVKPEHRHLKFLNAILIVEAAGDVHDLADQLRRIEDDLGRRRTLDRYAPRPVDIDLVYWGAARIQSGGLVIPHPHWAERRFVVQPLADVRPDLVLPGCAETAAGVLAKLGDEAGVRLLTRNW
jgi:2-amino-4-hydroxy-6-hydroxymethyldihydropteridine diphosphokinase